MAYFMECLVNNEETLSNLKIGTLDMAIRSGGDVSRWDTIDLFNPGIIRHINIIKGGTERNWKE